jgi:hypothetical protein
MPSEFERKKEERRLYNWGTLNFYAHYHWLVQMLHKVGCDAICDGYFRMVSHNQKTQKNNPGIEHFIFYSVEWV